MAKKHADIDIDVQSTFDPSNLFDIVHASRVQDGKLLKHPVGVYFQRIPVDPVTGYAAIPYDATNEYDYFKIDMLHLHILNLFDSKQQIRALLRQAPDWDMLQSEANVSKLFQLSKHFAVVNKMKPRSILDIADCIAIIRPGKRILLDKYVFDRAAARVLLYQKHSDSDYKRSHAVAYAHIVVLQMHLISAGII
jgi:hypothetical protein